MTQGFVVSGTTIGTTCVVPPHAVRRRLEQKRTIKVIFIYVSYENMRKLREKVEEIS
jgi:hypothetical protein